MTESQGPKLSAGQDLITWQRIVARLSFLQSFEVAVLLGMVTYQTALYQVKYIDAEFGWDYDQLLFESGIHKEPWKAMMEFDFHEPSHNNWFATMRMRKNGDIVEEDLFDTSVIEYPY